MQYRLRILVLFFCFMFCNNIFPQSKSLSPSLTYHIQESFQTQSLPSINWILEEGEEPLDISSLEKQDWKDSKYIDLQENPSFNIKPHKPYWFLLKISSSINIKDAGIYLGYQGDCWPFQYSYRSVEAFTLKNNNVIAKGKSGLALSATDRDFPKTLDPSLIKFNIEANEELEIWVKIIKIESCNINVDLALWGNKIIHAPRPLTTFLSLNILINGAIIALFFLTLILYYWSKEKLYLWFMVFQIFLLLASLNNNFHNEIFNLFFQNNPGFPASIAPLLGMAWMSTLIHFGRIYINTKKNFPRIHIVLGFCIIALLIIGTTGNLTRRIPSLSSENWFPVINFSVLFIMAMIMFSLIYFIFSKNKLARFYSIGTLLPIGGMLFGVISIEIFNSARHDVILIMHAGLIVTMTLALAYRFRLLTQERKTALEEKLNAEFKNSQQLKKINAASNKFVPQTFLNFLGKKNILDATLGDYVEKQVSVLFSDIRDYTTLAEQMTPEENFKFVNAFNQRMGPIIQKHNGFINQYLGDGIMAIFPENTEDILFAAIAMQQRLNTYNENRITKNKIPIRMGIGIHTGPLIMGIIGDKNRFDAATISDSVNSASRIEELTKYYGASILLSEVSLKKLENAASFHFRYLGEVQVKGKLKPLKIYECFDGDASDLFDLKLATLVQFESGINFYFKKSFARAMLSFESVLHQNPKDRTSQLFLRKATKLDTQGVQEDWTGVEMMLEK